MIEGRGTVFVVDDDLSVRRGLERLLRAAGLRVQTFASAHAFLEGGRLDGPGCLVLDVRMPGQSGLDLHEMLVAGGHSIPVVFITGHGDVPMTVRAKKGGAVDFVLKPFDDHVLLNVIQQAIARSCRRPPSSVSPMRPTADQAAGLRRSGGS